MNMELYGHDLSTLAGYFALGGTALTSVVGGWTAIRANRVAAMSMRAQEATLAQMVIERKDLNYSNLTREYLNTKAKLPSGFSELPLETKLSERQEAAARDMIQLFCKEHRAFVTHGLQDADWQEFMEGMGNFGLSPHGSRVWSSVRDNRHAEIPERFRVFYNKFLDEEREKRSNGKVNGHFPTNIMQDKQPMQIGGR